uniref:Type I polyketide synthase ketoyl reductase domain protein n=1 Tax=Gambierdiscus excentricus TaxID=986170 RepID=A0A1S6K837_9DINO|nr:type I polyketide synthase ketoyl reductase domain protein [Gambierdiscus excentricus]
MEPARSMDNFPKGDMDETRQAMTMVGEMDPAKMQVAYEQVMKECCEKAAGETCWPVDWFPEPMPTENSAGNATSFYLQAFADYLGTQTGQWPPAEFALPSKEDCLVFSDSYGYCKEVMDQAPPNRLGIVNVQNRQAAKYNEKDVKALVTMHPWDLILFGLGVDPPSTNRVADVHQHQLDVVLVFLTILKTVGDDPSRCKRIAVLTVDTFAEEREIHEECGIGLICNCTLFGMSNTARLEVQCPVQYIDTEWALRTENTKYIVAEIFRHQSFGHNAVRILNSGRYVLRQMPCKPYENLPDWQLPDHGIIAISGGNGALGLVMGMWLLNQAKRQGGKKVSIQFLSRSCKIADENMANWKEVQRLGEELDIPVSQEKCNCGAQESVDEYIRSVTPNLVGFIHSAGVLADSMLMNQSREKFETVYQAKSRAALFLHDALERFENPDLKFFWLFSSGAVYGNMGQLNYSSSNAFLDGLARHRRAMGKPCMAPQWGAWGEVGMAVNLDDATRRRMTNSPMPYFSNAEGLYGLECGLRTNLPYFSVFKVNLQLLFALVQGDDVPMQNYQRNFTSEFCPPHPGDPNKSHYNTLSYELRKRTNWIANGLVFSHHWAKLADEMKYYGDC